MAIVLSDLHIGSGHTKGQLNFYDDFREDARLEQLLSHYTAGRNQDAEVHLLLNGDVFDLLKVSVNGKFPDAITERLALMKLEQCLKGHPRAVKAIGSVLANPKNRITYQAGNHDMEVLFPGVQRMLCRALTGEETHQRLMFVSEAPFFEIEDGIQLHHGHQFEALHAMDFQKPFLTRGHREPILNLPWGSLFMLHVVNKLLGERPYLDKVMPFWPLFVGGLFFDTAFTLKMLGVTAVAYTKARLNPMWWEKRPFDKLSRFLRSEVNFFESLDHFARRILSSPKVNAVFMGHTHAEMVRTYPRGKIYVNTGSWMPMLSLHLPHLGLNRGLHFGLIRWEDSGPPRVALMRWHGTRALSEEVIS